MEEGGRDGGVKILPCHWTEIIDVLVQACEETEEYVGKVTHDSARTHLPGFDSFKIVKDGECIGGIIIKDSEAHIAVLKKYRKKWATKELYRFARDQGIKRGLLVGAPMTKESQHLNHVLHDRGLLCLKDT